MTREGTRHYVAVLPTRYQSVAIGKTPARAREAAARAWLAMYPRDAREMGIETVTAVLDYYGCNVFGPIADGEGQTE